MGLYENGIDTRKAILEACTALFMEKGYRATSIDDICQAAHVNRGSIYYHFRDKENIRYEVLWSNIMGNLHRVRECCGTQEYDMILAMYLLWHQICTDENMRRFHTEYFRDYPVYSPKENLSRSIKMVTELMYQKVMTGHGPDRMEMSFLYGFLMSVTMIAARCEFTPEALFRRTFEIGNQIRGIPQEEISAQWQHLHALLLRLPGWREPCGDVSVE